MAAEKQLGVLEPGPISWRLEIQVEAAALLSEGGFPTWRGPSRLLGIKCANQKFSSSN